MTVRRLREAPDLTKHEEEPEFSEKKLENLSSMLGNILKTRADKKTVEDLRVTVSIIKGTLETIKSQLTETEDEVAEVKSGETQTENDVKAVKEEVKTVKVQADTVFSVLKERVQQVESTIPLTDDLKNDVESIQKTIKEIQEKLQRTMGAVDALARLPGGTKLSKKTLYWIEKASSMTAVTYVVAPDSARQDIKNKANLVLPSSIMTSNITAAILAAAQQSNGTSYRWGHIKFLPGLYNFGERIDFPPLEDFIIDARGCTLGQQADGSSASGIRLDSMIRSQIYFGQVTGVTSNIALEVAPRNNAEVAGGSVIGWTESHLYVNEISGSPTATNKTGLKITVTDNDFGISWSRFDIHNTNYLDTSIDIPNPTGTGKIINCHFDIGTLHTAQTALDIGEAGSTLIYGNRWTIKQIDCDVLGVHVFSQQDIFELSEVGGGGSALTWGSSAANNLLITTPQVVVAGITNNSGGTTNRVVTADTDSLAVIKTDYTAKGMILAGSAANAPTGLAVGGTTGYVLTVDATEATGLKWAAATAAATGAVEEADYTAKGALLAGSAAGAPTVLAISGTAGYVLIADSAEVTGMKWGAAPAGTPGGTITSEMGYGQSAAAGTAAEYARGDHTHGTPADLVTGTAHADLTTGVHGAGTANLATTSQITAHAALDGTHGAGTIASVAAVTSQITTHAGSTDPHNVYTLKTAYTAKGTLLAGSAASAPTALAVGGTAGYVLTVDSVEATGMKWAAAGAGTPSGTAVSETTLAGSAVAAGTASEYSRGDHTHGTPQITNYLEATPTNGEAAKAPNSNWAFDHDAAASGIHGAGTANLATTSDITTHAGAANPHTVYLLKQLAENDPLLLDAALSATGQYSGIAISGTSNAALAFGQLCYIVGGSTRWGLSAATVASGIQRLGICVGAATGSADTTLILLYGNVRAAAMTCCTLATSGSAVFISNTAGSVIGTAPSAGSSIVRVIGHSLAASALLFDPDGAWIELA